MGKVHLLPRTRRLPSCLMDELVQQVSFLSSTFLDVGLPVKQLHVPGMHSSPHYCSWIEQETSLSFWHYNHAVFLDTFYSSIQKTISLWIWELNKAANIHKDLRYLVHCNINGEKSVIISTVCTASSFPTIYLGFPHNTPPTIKGMETKFWGTWKLCIRSQT